MIETTKEETLDKISIIKNNLVIWAGVGSIIGCANTQSDVVMLATGGLIGLGLGVMFYTDSKTRILNGEYDNQQSNRGLKNLSGVKILHKTLLKEAAFDSLGMASIAGVATFGAILAGAAFNSILTNSLGVTGSVISVGGLMGLAVSNLIRSVSKNQTNINTENLVTDSDSLKNKVIANRNSTENNSTDSPLKP